MQRISYPPRRNPYCLARSFLSVPVGEKDTGPTTSRPATGKEDLAGHSRQSSRRQTLRSRSRRYPIDRQLRFLARSSDPIVGWHRCTQTQQSSDARRHSGNSGRAHAHITTGCVLYFSGPRCPTYGPSFTHSRR